MNVGPEVTDLVLANLTVHNDYGGRFGDADHQFAIRSGGNTTRIALLHATVRADGGDTVSLWNGTSGLYYHAECAFEGHVDFVCPRGWAYITNSRFFGRNLSASIWHDGSKDADQKLVIRRSYFDGVPGFPLGRHHRDAQFYLLDAVFSRNMADRAIYKAPADNPYLWGERAYYSGCRREGGDYAWFADNLAQAPGAPDEADVTPAWTFARKLGPRRHAARRPAVRGDPAAGERRGGRCRAASRCAGSADATRCGSASISARRPRRPFVASRLRTRSNRPPGRGAHVPLARGFGHSVRGVVSRQGLVLRGPGARRRLHEDTRPGDCRDAGRPGGRGRGTRPVVGAHGRLRDRAASGSDDARLRAAPSGSTRTAWC